MDLAAVQRRPAVPDPADSRQDAPLLLLQSQVRVHEYPDQVWRSSMSLCLSRYTISGAPAEKTA
jgi:hypothetical protein